MPGKIIHTRFAVAAAAVAAIATTATGPAQSAPRETVRAAHVTTCQAGGGASGARAKITWTNRSATVDLIAWDRGTWFRPTKAFIEAHAGRTYVDRKDLTADEGQATGRFTFSTTKPGGITVITLWTKLGLDESQKKLCGR